MTRRRPAWPQIFALLALLGAASPHHARAAEPAGTEPIVLGDRTPIAFLLLTPTGKIGNATSSDIIRIVSDLLGEHTDLALAQFDGTNVADCKGLLACFARKVRAERGQAGRAKLLLVLSNLTQDRAADRLSVTLVDLDRAEELDREVGRADEDWEAELEARLAEGGILARPRWGAVDSETAARGYLEAVFANELRRAFEATGHYDPYGELELDVTRAGLALELDGTTVGLTRAPKTRVARVHPGHHTLRVSGPKVAPFATEITVERHQVARARAELVAEGDRPVYTRGLFWTGVGAAVAGAAITTVALVRRDGSVQTLCVPRPGATCKDGSAFETSGYAPDRAPSFSDVNPPGLLLAPLGYSLAGAGVAWMASSLLFDDPERFPWLELGLGLALGAASYGLSAALDGPSAFSR